MADPFPIMGTRSLPVWAIHSTTGAATRSQRFSSLSHPFPPVPTRSRERVSITRSPFPPLSRGNGSGLTTGIKQTATHSLPEGLADDRHRAPGAGDA
jgi:hypothetical protein